MSDETTGKNSGADCDYWRSNFENAVANLDHDKPYAWAMAVAAAYAELLANGCQEDDDFYITEAISPNQAGPFRILAPGWEDKPFDMVAKSGRLEAWDTRKAGSDWTHYWRSDNHGKFQQVKDAVGKGPTLELIPFQIFGVGGDHDGQLLQLAEKMGEVGVSPPDAHSYPWWGLEWAPAKVDLALYHLFKFDDEYVYAGQMGFNGHDYDSGYVGYADVQPTNTRRWFFHR
ncbi:hypothetical protein [Streptomyces sp. SID3343]|uniref:hypothetical protein n=1 Tax=Streptomyces sp. SID3343 TaxID=2690260 RepID=UPI001369116C|nr:hypothetical protein [Streptomyces sp. SID3343]MYW04803.1 hypothetical protein [Streptomyces sp. SID3343]